MHAQRTDSHPDGVKSLPKLHGRVEPSERITLDRLAVDGTYHTIDNGVTRRWNGITDEYVDTLDARGEGE